jgi:ABC-2 type transport system ATP-binding protein
MLHDPKVLILDEPTSGLDPNQLSEIRKLIRELGREKTVILSTHIMQEVEAICDRVVIINKGRIVANDDTKNLQARTSGEIVYRVEFDKPAHKNQLESILGVKEATRISENVWLLATSAGIDTRANIFEYAVKNNLVMLSTQKEEQSLEDVFRQLTKN